MPRPTFSLTDDQARLLRDALPEIVARHPPSAMSNRAFVRDFLRAVHTATGRTFGPAIYRRLLNTYTPERKPSNETLAQEKALLVQALSEETNAAQQVNSTTADALQQVIQRSIDQGFKRFSVEKKALADQPYNQIQQEFLHTKLTETEQALQQIQAYAARLAADLQATIAVRDTLQQQLTANQTLLETQAHAMQQLMQEVQGQRQFALRAMDEVRGETRAWRERCEHTEQQLQQATKHLEYFRKMAYQRGSAMPPDLGVWGAVEQ